MNIVNPNASFRREFASTEPTSCLRVYLGERRGVRDRIGRIRNTGWVNARRRAADKYPSAFGKEAPLGFRELRAHDLRHTVGRRLRSAGVSKEDRKDLLGHKSGDVTTDYSAAELMNLIEAANLIVRSKDSPTLTVLRLVA
jgi:integrase